MGPSATFGLPLDLVIITKSHPGSNLELLGGISLPNTAMQYQATA
jgi:hypothetical protein